MFKAWLQLWKQTADYRGKTSRKDYWSAILLHVITMYMFVIPYTLLLMLFTRSVAVIATSYLILVHIPVFAMYVRRARDAGWTLGTTLYLAVATPVISGLLVGAFSSRDTKSAIPLRFISVSLGYALFFYGGVFGLLLYGDVTALPALPVAGLLLVAATLIVYGIVHWREVLVVLGIDANKT